MDREQWNRIEELLQRALDLEPEARAAFLANECGELRGDVEALLASHLSLLSRPAATLRPSHAGATVGHYRIERIIGAGGMGEVYEARDERLRRQVAIKALPAEFTADPARVRRFEQEALTASRLNHPNIITIFEIIHDGDAHFIAEELVDGMTLRELLRRGPVSWEKALDIATQAAAALKEAHASGIVHRDVKPENIMLRSDGLVKVLDFGIAKLAEESDVALTGETPANPLLTIPGAVLGTAQYMSPEQARGETLDGRTDIYSLGVVLREMLKDRRAPKELLRITRRMAAYDREQRYPSSAELLDELQRLRRRIESRSARRISMMIAAGAILLLALAAWLSIEEVWQEQILRDGHTAAVRQAVFSPDGRLLLSCSEDGTLIVWDFARRQRIATLAQRATKVAFAPNGRWFASGGYDGTVTVWDAARRVKLHTLHGYRGGGEVGALQFSPDASLLAAGVFGADGGRTLVWSTPDWTLRHSWFGGTYGSFVFARDLRQMLTSYGLHSFDLARGVRLTMHSDRSANWVARSPAAPLVASIESLGDVCFFDLPDGDRFERMVLRAKLRAHQDHGRAVAFSPDGRLLVSAADDIVLWDAATREKLARFEHTAITWSATFSPDGRWLVSSHGDGSVLVWDVRERQRVASMSEHSAAVRTVAFSADGRTIASAGEDRVVAVWDAETGRKKQVLQRHTTRVTGVAFLPGGAIASGDMDGVIIVWNAAGEPRQLARSPLRHPSLTLTTSRDGGRIMSAEGIFDPAGRLLRDFQQLRAQRSYGVASSADGRFLANVTEGGWVMVWEARTLRLAGRRRIAASLIAVSLSADGERLVTGEDEGAVRLWSVQPLRELGVIGRHAARVKSVAFAPDGRTAASAGDDKMIALWNVDRRVLERRIGTHVSPIYAIAFSPDGTRLVSGGHDRTVRLYTRQKRLWRWVAP